MQRDFSVLGDRRFDLLVIGAGVLGSCIAWDASLRGLSVALIDRGDFGALTSANSLKIVHGGLRYLQRLDLRRVRASIRERSTWLRVAPHLVEPLPVLVPTYRWKPRQTRSVLRLALALNDLLGWDRNRDLVADRRLPAGTALSRRDVIDRVPELVSPDLTGGVIFHDAQMYDSERLVLSVVRAASQRNAVCVNYAAFERVRGSDDAGLTVEVRDVLTGDRAELHAGSIVNAAGPQVEAVAASLVGRRVRWPGLGYSLGINLMLPEKGRSVAFAARSNSGSAASDTGQQRGARQLFFVPWRRRLMVGTGHFDVPGGDPSPEVVQRAVERFITEVNGALPGARPIDREDVVLVHSGVIPVARTAPGEESRFLRQSRIVDHAADGQPHVYTVLTGKYTTARCAAERVVDRIAASLDRTVGPCRTAQTRLPGAPTEPVGRFVHRVIRRHAGEVDEDVLEHLARTHGTEYARILESCRAVDSGFRRIVPGEPVVRGQWRHAIREEQAVTPDDLIHRRTELGARGLATNELTSEAAQLLAIAKPT